MVHLENQITSLEIETAIQQMKSGKAPGLDGLTTEFYKTFKTELTPYIEGLSRYCLEYSVLPPSWGQARLVLIPPPPPRKGCERS